MELENALKEFCFPSSFGWGNAHWDGEVTSSEGMNPAGSIGEIRKLKLDGKETPSFDGEMYYDGCDTIGLLLKIGSVDPADLLSDIGTELVQLLALLNSFRPLGCYYLSEDGHLMLKHSLYLSSAQLNQKLLSDVVTASYLEAILVENIFSLVKADGMPAIKALPMIRSTL